MACERPCCGCGGADADSAGYRVLKAVLDSVGATAALVALAPVLLVIAAAVRLTSPGPALFRQERVGQHEARFTMYKFRTMRRDADDAAHRAYVTHLLSDDAKPEQQDGLFKLGSDPRITRVGRVLRRTSLDELPQLFNVLRGEMSLVGPRPALPWEAELYRPEHRRRFAVKPGITGLWQVSGRGSIPMREALDLDVVYVRSRALGLDLRILARTARTVLRGEGAR